MTNSGNRMLPDHPSSLLKISRSMQSFAYRRSGIFAIMSENKKAFPDYSGKAFPVNELSVS